MIRRRSLNKLTQYYRQITHRPKHHLKHLPKLTTATALGLVFSAASWAQNVPKETDFQKVTVAENLNLPLEFEISNTGDIFVVGKCGEFWGWQIDGPAVTTPRITLPNVRCDFEDGLLSIAIDPNFASNRHIFVQYMAPGAVTRVSRFTVDNNYTPDIGSEKVVIEWASREAAGHAGGSMMFDLDGNLLISTGDNQGATGYFSAGGQGTSGNTNDLRGKILRIRPTADGGYTIPNGNLFPQDATHRGEIYAMGFRNPFRMNLDSKTGWVYVGDVGPDASADSAEGPMGQDEINEVRQAGNFGWPWVLGQNQPYQGFDPNNLRNTYQENTGAVEIPAPVPAVWTILHRGTMSGPVYRYDDSIENEFKLPPYYDGHLIFWDFNSSKFFTFDVENDPRPPIPVEMPFRTQGMQGAIDVEFDPRTQQLYVLQWGSGCCDKEPFNNGGLYRFDYVGGRDDGVNVALGASASASTEVNGNIAAYAVDGDPVSRWESTQADPQTLQLDLHEPYVFETILLNWEAAYSSSYTIEASNDAVNWDLLINKTDGAGGVEYHVIDSNNPYRYVRVTGRARGTAYGHSLEEIEIYAAEETLPPQPLPEFAYLNMPRDLDANFTDVPRLLSQTGVFNDVRTMSVIDNMIPFEPNAKLWSDRALKSRWISLPEGSQVQWSEKEDWVYPEGTVAVKHFELPLDERNPSITRRLETRLTITKANGRIYGVTYRWRPDYSDAELLTDAVNEDFTITDNTGNTWTQTWSYPSPGQCLECHNDESAKILGLSTRQINKVMTYPNGVRENQLVHWNNRNLFTPAFNNLNVNDFDRMVAIDDTSASLEKRVKSYLDANCAHCHGTGNGGSQWDARFNTALEDMKAVDQKTTGIRNYVDYYGIENAQVISSMNPHQSILYIRDKSENPDDRMPPLGRALEDKVYIDVLDQWLVSLGQNPPQPTVVPTPTPDPGTDLDTPFTCTAYASTDEGPFTATNVCDQNDDTRWSSEWNDNEWIVVDLGESRTIGQVDLLWEAAYATAYDIQVSNDQANWQTIYSEADGDGQMDSINVDPVSARYVRMLGKQRSTGYGYSLFTMNVFGFGNNIPQPPTNTPQPTPTPDISQPLSCTGTSSSQEGDYVASNVCDNDDTVSRWASDWSDNQWIRLDLGETHRIINLTLIWETAYGSAYDVQVSDNGNNWVTVFTENEGDGGVDEISLNNASGRYLRIFGRERATEWGFSLFTVNIHGYVDGGPVNTPQPTVNPTATPTPTPTSTPTPTPTPTPTVNPPPTNVPAPHVLDVIGLESSSSIGGNIGNNILDGNPQTRWESEHKIDPQFVILDLGQSTYVTGLTIQWEGAYAKSYSIDISENKNQWSTIYSTTTGNGGEDKILLNGQQGRFVRIYGTERNTDYGYSILDASVEGLAADPSYPIIDVAAPLLNAQIPQSDDVMLRVNMNDVSWFANGGSYHYSLDGGAYQRVYNANAINLGKLSTGKHNLRVSLVNGNNQEISVPRQVGFSVTCGNDCPTVLVFSKTSGFRHGSIEAGIEMVEKLGDTYGYHVTATEDSSVFTDANLAQYNTIVFMNTTGDIFDGSQKAAFQRYIENGGGYVGTHSAADTEHSWDWYTNTLLAGAEFIHHGDGIPEAVITIENPVDSTLNHIDGVWSLADEWYFFEGNPRNSPTVDVIATLDRSSYPSNYPVEDHPIIFKNTVGSGRAYYTAIGHRDENFAEEDVIEMIRKAIEWTSAK